MKRGGVEHDPPLQAPDVREVRMIRFQIPGKPQGKGRPRFSRGRTYTPANTVAYEKAIGFAARVGMGDLSVFTGPLEVHLTVNLEPVKSASRKARAAMLSGETPPAKKPDLDNIIKAVLDGMNGIAYVDDAQVCRLVVEKRYADVEGVDVAIFPISCRVDGQSAERSDP